MGQCPFRPNPSTTAPAPELTEDLVEEILLRFPPSVPASLVRASLVCKQWCRLISEPRFRRRVREFHLRYREFHRTPPMLGFFCTTLARDGVETVRFVPTSTFWSPRAADLRHCRPIDAPHGRVLLQCPGKAPSETVLVVWDPISDERRELPVPTRWGEATRWSYGWNAAVLCAAHGTCHHLDCHRGPFLVVFVDATNCTRNLFISTYSSDSGTWSDRIFSLHPAYYLGISSLPCAHVGNALYFTLEMSDTALKYDLCLHEASGISIPCYHTLVFPYVLTTTEDGRLRCTVLHISKLYMWSWDDSLSLDARWRRDAPWTQDRVIDLKMLLLINAIWASPRIVGFADGAGVIFLTADGVHFTVDLNTKKVKKVSKDITVNKALPYMSFYTPGPGYRPATAVCNCENGGGVDGDGDLSFAVCAYPRLDSRVGKTSLRDATQLLANEMRKRANFSNSIIFKNIIDRQIGAAVGWGKRRSSVAAPKIAEP